MTKNRHYPPKTNDNYINSCLVSLLWHILCHNTHSSVEYTQFSRRQTTRQTSRTINEIITHTHLKVPDQHRQSLGNSQFEEPFAVSSCRLHAVTQHIKLIYSLLASTALNRNLSDCTLSHTWTSLV